MKFLFSFMFVVAAAAESILPVLHVFHLESDHAIELETETFKSLVGSEYDFWSNLEFVDSHKVLWYERVLLKEGKLVGSGLSGSLSKYDGFKMDLGKRVEATWRGGDSPMYGLDLEISFPKIEWRTEGGKPIFSVASTNVTSNVTLRAGRPLVTGELRINEGESIRYQAVVIVVEELKAPILEVFLSDDGLSIDGKDSYFYNLKYRLGSLPEETKVVLSADSTAKREDMLSVMSLIKEFKVKKVAFGSRWSEQVGVYNTDSSSASDGFGH